MKHFKHIWKWTMNQRILFGIFIIVLILPNFILSFTEFVSLVTRIINVVLPLGVFWFLMTLSNKPGRMIWILFIFIFFNAFQIVLLYLFGNSVIAVDMFLNLVTTNSVEAYELLGNLVPALIMVFLIYIPTLALGVVSLTNKKVLSRRFIKLQRAISISIIVLSCGLLVVEYNINPDFKIQDDVYPINVCYNIGLAVERENMSRNYHETSRDFKFHSVSSHYNTDKEIYVLIVGETARANNFGIYGYKRPTTPCLDSIASDLVIFRDVISQSNTTHKSVPMLLSAASAEEYDRLYTEKSIITAFKEAGFSTSFFSNQRPNHSYIDFFAEEADDCVFIKDNLPLDVNVSDDSLLDMVDKKIKESTSNKIFIVLHTYGSHFNYKERYPREMSYFKPDNATTVGFKYKEDLINGYDNSIRYTDQFIGRLVALLGNENAQSSLIFTSDHGEDLYDDDRKLFLHASPIPTYYQLRVPFIIWLSKEYKEKYPNTVKALMQNRDKPISSSLVTFHTMLSIAGIKGTGIDDKKSVADSTFEIVQRFYLNDHMKPEPLDKIGLKKYDIDNFHRDNIQYP